MEMLICFQMMLFAAKLLSTGSSASAKYKRIIGGTKASQHEFPWQASIIWRVGISKGEHICGATLVHKDYVLTAAHCFEHGVNTQYYSIILGDHLKDTVHAHEEVKEIESIHMHPSYNTSTQDGDLTLVKLKTPAALSKYVQIVALPKFFDFEIPGSTCTISGWGDNGVVKIANVLHKADVNIINFGLCNHYQSYAGRLTSNMFCAGHKDGLKDTCQGDSGGPLQCLRQGKWVLNGVTSWGDGCGKKHKYGVYVTVRHYVPWINSYLKSNGKTLPPPPPPPKPKIPLPPPPPPPPPKSKIPPPPPQPKPKDDLIPPPPPKL